MAAKGGVVTLLGFVSNYAQKMTAEHAAERVQGVQGIAEELKVRFPSDPKASDEELHAEFSMCLRGTLRSLWGKRTR